MTDRNKDSLAKLAAPAAQSTQQQRRRFDGEGGGLNRTRYEANFIDEEPTGEE